MKQYLFSTGCDAQGFRCLLVTLSLIFSSTPDCEAVTIAGGTPQRHERYFQGTGKAFFASQFDWSGVGRSVSRPGRTPVRAPWLTMISPSYFISAAHFPPRVGEDIIFHHTNDPNGPSELKTLGSPAERGQRLGDTDIWLGKFATPVSDAVAKYPIYPLLSDFDDYRNKEIYVVGRSPFTNPVDRAVDVALGRNRIDRVRTSSSTGVTTLQHSFNPGSGFSPDETRVVTGDSGAPSFILEDRKLGFAGTHWTASSDAFLPVHFNTIKAIVEANGESLVAFVPEPTTWSLMTLSLMAVGLRRHRRGRTL